MSSVTPQTAETRVRTYPTVPSPTRDLASLQAAVERLKEGYELLTGQTGPREYSMQEGLTQVRRQVGNTTARMLELNEVQTSANNALAQRTTIIETEITNARGGLTSLSAKITAVDQSRIDGDAALASRTTTLETSVNSPTSANNPTFARLVTEESTRATADSGFAVKFGVTGTINATSGGFTFSGVQKLDGSVSYGMEFEVGTFKIKDPTLATAKTVFAYNAGKFEFTGDVAVQGNLIVSGTVNTPQIAPNATSRTAAAIGLLNNATHSLSLTVRANAEIIIVASVTKTNDLGTYTVALGTYNFNTRQYYINVNGTTVQTMRATDVVMGTIAGSSTVIFGPGNVTETIRVTGLAEGIHTFALNNPNTIEMNCSISVTELAR